MIIEIGYSILFERLAHPETDPSRADRDCARHGLTLLIGRQRKQVADPDLVCEGRAGPQQFHAVEHYAVVLFGCDLKAMGNCRLAPV